MRLHFVRSPTHTPDVIGFAITFRPHASAAPNVIGFAITFRPHASAALNVIGFPITFRPHASVLPNVIGFATTFGTRTSRMLKKAPFPPRGNPVLSRTALQMEKGALTINP
ncbi:hypothetical protein MKY96_16570 [Paenibacillus sp. FSL R7-0302]|uniref:hypothetical protein n=1 Tax=Paenibacillus sp. FSL R7-0302 TaxID=2921681 RepID=UPI0030F589C2